MSAASNLQRIALVISHELAHQWFGNLVTPSWWSDLWLNEGKEMLFITSFYRQLSADIKMYNYKIKTIFTFVEIEGEPRPKEIISQCPMI